MAHGAAFMVLGLWRFGIFCRKWNRPGVLYHRSDLTTIALLASYRFGLSLPVWLSSLAYFTYEDSDCPVHSPDSRLRIGGLDICVQNPTCHSSALCMYILRPAPGACENEQQ